MFTELLAGAGLLSGVIGSLFNDDSEQTRAAKDLINRIRNLAGYTNEEIERNVADINRAATTQVFSTANALALAGNARQNLLTNSVSQLLPQLTMYGVERSQALQDYNKRLELQKLVMESQLLPAFNTDTTQDDFFSVLGLGLQGGQLGSVFDQLNSIKRQQTAQRLGWLKDVIIKYPW